MNEIEQTIDGKTESCSSVSPEFQSDEQNLTQAELETTRFTVEDGKMTVSYLLTVNLSYLEVICISDIFAAVHQRGLLWQENDLVHFRS